ALRDQLNEVLPPRYFAEVQISLGKQVEIDVATFEEDAASGVTDEGGVAVWAPPRPPQTVLLPAAPTDVFEVQVFTDEGGPRLVAGSSDRGRIAAHLAMLDWPRRLPAARPGDGVPGRLRVFTNRLNDPGGRLLDRSRERLRVGQQPHSTYSSNPSGMASKSGAM